MLLLLWWSFWWEIYQNKTIPNFCILLLIRTSSLLKISETFASIDRSFIDQNKTKIIKTAFYRNLTYPFINNKLIADASIKSILETKRFHRPLFLVKSALVQGQCELFFNNDFKNLFCLLSFFHHCFLL